MKKLPSLAPLLMFNYYLYHSIFIPLTKEGVDQIWGQCKLIKRNEREKKATQGTLFYFFIHLSFVSMTSDLATLDAWPSVKGSIFMVNFNLDSSNKKLVINCIIMYFTKASEEAFLFQKAENEIELWKFFSFSFSFIQEKSFQTIELIVIIFKPGQFIHSLHSSNLNLTNGDKNEARLQH